MFVIERHHQRVKGHAEAVRNTRTFSESVLMRILDSQLTALHASFGVMKPCVPERKIRIVCDGVGAYVADSLAGGGAPYHVDDIVERDATIGCVIACFARDDGLRALRVEIFLRSRTPDAVRAF